MTRRATVPRRHLGRAAATAVVGLLAAASASAAQGPRIAPRSGTISGRVVAESGRPLRNAQVYVFAAGTEGNEERDTRVDAEGKFAVDGLAPGAYTVGAYAPGYTSDRGRWADVHFVGESVTLRLAKGGVITGKVTDADGRPVVAVKVGAIPVRDADGEPLSPSDVRAADETDDQGVYRIFGLGSGRYIVVAGGAERWSGYPRGAYSDGAATYYPSATRATASEVAVRAGDEAVGVDIQYRDETGHTVSGNVTGFDARADGSVAVTLTPGDRAGLTTTVSFAGAGSDGAFRVQGAADGEYELYASLNTVRGATARSPLTRIVVRGADVSGLRLALEPLASVAGTVVVEPPLAPDPCPEATRRSVDETLATLDRTDAAFRALPNDDGRRLDAPNAKGEFAVEALAAGRYRVGAVLPDARWYVASVSREPNGGDVARDGLVLATGQRVTGLRIAIAYGAAAITGRVTSADAKADPPRGANVVLVPAEPERAEDPLRYFEAIADAGGVFTLEHLPPGKYRVVVRVAAKRAAPFASDAAKRMELRKLAEANGREVELLPCQRIENAVVTVAAATREQ